MAKRPIFIPSPEDPSYVKQVDVNFTWYAGMALSQAQKSVQSLHQAATQLGYSPILEISSKSTLPLGVALSAFNLILQAPDGQKISVESAFQGSKAFKNSGPFHDLYSKTSREAKQDARLRIDGDVVVFNFKGDKFPTQPLTAFYDWLYITALSQNPQLSQPLLQYNGFTDIAFNPEKSFNCQARSAALYVAMARKGVLGQVLEGWENYYQDINKSEPRAKNENLPPQQPGLPF